MVVRRWRELEFNHSALNQFEKRQLAIASEIMEVRFHLFSKSNSENNSNLSMRLLFIIG